MAHHLAIETSLRWAAGTAQISLAYVPVVELQTGRRRCVDAVLHWAQPTMGSIGQQEFLPIAAEPGLMDALGRWALEQACLAVTSWPHGITESAPERISWCISRSELRGTLRSSALPAGCFQIDVSGRDLMQDTDNVLRLMIQLRSWGVRSGLRDFDAGHCSLALLRESEFDNIRMARSICQDLRTDTAGLAVFGATLSLIRNLNSQSVAVGIESSAQLAVLQSRGCGFGQGSLFEAVPAIAAVLAPTWQAALARECGVHGYACAIRSEDQAGKRFASFNLPSL